MSSGATVSQCVPDAKPKYENSIPPQFNRFCKYRDTFALHDINCLQLLSDALGRDLQGRAELSAGPKLA